MAEYLVVAQIKCICGYYMTLRAVQETYGGEHTVPCWVCNREVTLKGNQGYCEGEKRPTQIISRELRKK